MQQIRSWAVRNARWLNTLYKGIEYFLCWAQPLLQRIGYQHFEKPVFAIEKRAKGFLLDSGNCGQCIVAYTGMSCPMNCPKSIRNGPCGGVRSDGKCEIKADMNCVWVLAWDGNKRIHADNYPIQVVQPPIDHRLMGSSAWLHQMRKRASHAVLAESVDREI